MLLCLLGFFRCGPQRALHFDITRIQGEVIPYLVGDVLVGGLKLGDLSLHELVVGRKALATGLALALLLGCLGHRLLRYVPWSETLPAWLRTDQATVRESVSLRAFPGKPADDLFLHRTATSFSERFCSSWVPEPHQPWERAPAGAPLLQRVPKRALLGVASAISAGGGHSFHCACPRILQLPFCPALTLPSEISAR